VKRSGAAPGKITAVAEGEYLSDGFTATVARGLAALAAETPGKRGKRSAWSNERR
jgi:hypothetical protein